MRFFPFFLAATMAVSPVVAAEAPRTMIVMDGSGSMWGQIEGTAKLDIARRTLSDVLAAAPDRLELGLMAYGHREKGNCQDIELIVPPGPGTASAISEAAGAMRFLGKTPLSAAVQMAADTLRYTEDRATVVLITDGIETCDADPCALASALEHAGVGFTAHVIGFGLSRDDGARVACIAENTGGRYFNASDANSLADALTTAMGGGAQSVSAPPPPAPETPRHFPGAALMPGIALTPTGGSFGDRVAAPAAPAFPPDGTAAQCRVLCEADGLCGSWRFEPPGSFFVAEARCFVFSPQTEFLAGAYPLDEGWASGMKPEVIGLTRPYVPIGTQEIAARLSVPEPVIPGAEFTVLWSGPAGDHDWVDLVPAGHHELSGELSHFYVNDTIEANDRPEGAGVLTAPAEPGSYELRYVFGRELDRHVVMRVPLTVGGAGPGTAGDSASSPAGAPMPVEATFIADTGGQDLAISWSAVPVAGQNLPPEAWATPESATGPVTEHFLPGDYQVLGEAGDSVFAGRVTITAKGPNRFTIPYSDALSPAGEDTEGGYRCAESDPCRIEDASGLAFLLPAGWRTDMPFIAETAGGVKAPYPTVTFTSADGASTISLNPLRWLESSGTCSASGVGELCIHGQPGGEAMLAYATILPSLRYRPTP